MYYEYYIYTIYYIHVLQFAKWMRSCRDALYCKYEIPDHKVGINYNVIGPLAELRHSALSCKKVLRYFGKV